MAFGGEAVSEVGLEFGYYLRLKLGLKIIKKYGVIKRKDQRFFCCDASESSLHSSECEGLLPIIYYLLNLHIPSLSDITE